MIASADAVCRQRLNLYALRVLTLQALLGDMGLP